MSSYRSEPMLKLDSGQTKNKRKATLVRFIFSAERLSRGNSDPPMTLVTLLSPTNTQRDVFLMNTEVRSS